MQERRDDRMSEHDRMPEQDRIPPELDPMLQDPDEGPSRTFTSRWRPVIWLVAALALAALVVYALI